MAAEIGQLAVSLVARTGGLDAGLNKSANNIAKFQKRVEKTAPPVVTLGDKMNKLGIASGLGSTTLIGMGGALGAIPGPAVAAAVAIGSLSVALGKYKQILDDMDAQGKLAARLGMSTESLSGLQFAADIDGPGIEAFNKAMEQMQKRLSEGSEGKAAKAVEKLGISYKEFMALKADEQIKMLADRMNLLTDSSERARAHLDLFSKTGQQMMNFTALGGAGIAELQAEAKRRGQVLSDAEAEMADSMGDMFQRMEASSQGFWKRFTIHAMRGMGIAPELESAFSRVFNMDTAASGVARIMRLLPGFSQASTALTSIGGAIDAVGVSAEGAAKPVADLNDEFERMEKMEQDALQIINSNTTAWERYAEGLRKVNELEKENKLTKDQADRERASLEADFKRDDPGQQKILQDDRDTVAIMDRNKTAAERYADGIARVNELVRDGWLNDKQATREKERLAKAFHDTDEASLAMAKSQEEAKRIADEQDAAAQQIVDQTRTPEEEHAAQLKKLKAMLKSNTIDLDTYRRAVEQADTALRDAKGFDKAHEAMEAMALDMDRQEGSATETNLSRLAFQSSNSNATATTPASNFQGMISEQRRTNRILTQRTFAAVAV